MLFPSANSGAAQARVVVTGAGIVTPLGRGWKANAEGFRTGRIAFRPVSLFDVSRQRARTAAEVARPAELPPTCLTKRQEKRLDRASKLLLLAAHDAFAQSRWEPNESLPIVLGTTSGGMNLGEAYYRQAISQPRSSRHQAARVLQYQPQRQALDLADALGISGPITIIANACASGANAIGHAWHLVRSGQNARVLAGGYDALSQMVFAGFDSLQALSTTQCRPFDSSRDGLGLGEAAAVLCLESLESAQQRRAEILGEIAGYGSAWDAHHLTQPHPEGAAAFQAMDKACGSGNIDPAQITYINAHGTGTPHNDAAEAVAINRFLGDRAKNVSVSSTKSSVGHSLGAAGAVEALVCLMALREGWVPPTTNIKSVDPVCAFPVVGAPMRKTMDVALSNSFGFGGANATIALRRWL
jgi:3-oxoacyl-[acyl-carrier-protein] synthase II